MYMKYFAVPRAMSTIGGGAFGEDWVRKRLIAPGAQILFGIIIFDRNGDEGEGGGLKGGRCLVG